MDYFHSPPNSIIYFKSLVIRGPLLYHLYSITDHNYYNNYLYIIISYDYYNIYAHLAPPQPLQLPPPLLFQYHPIDTTITRLHFIGAHIIYTLSSSAPPPTSLLLPAVTVAAKVCTTWNSSLMCLCNHIGSPTTTSSHIQHSRPIPVPAQ